MLCVKTGDIVNDLIIFNCREDPRVTFLRPILLSYDFIINIIIVYYKKDVVVITTKLF